MKLTPQELDQEVRDQKVQDQDPRPPLRRTVDAIQSAVTPVVGMAAGVAAGLTHTKPPTSREIA